MKKFCMAALVLALVAAMSATAFASLGSIDFSVTEGKWTDAKTGDVIYMNGRGDFWAFPKSGEPYRGWLELDTDFEEGPFMYYMYNAKDFEFIDGFMFDTEADKPTFHIGNDDEFIYTRTGKYDDDNITLEENKGFPILTGTHYSSWEPLVCSNNYRGGYYYTDLANNDGIVTVITNCCMKNDRHEGESYQDYFIRCAMMISTSEGIDDIEFDGENFTSDELKEAEESLFSELDDKTYPVHVMRFLTGQNEDTTQWDMLIFQTETHTYAFTFATAADFAEDMAELWKDICLSERQLKTLD